VIEMANQQRDKKGRFKKNTTNIICQKSPKIKTIIVDESGDMGKRGGSDTYALGAVITHESEKIGKIALDERELLKKNNELIGNELKFGLAEEDMRIKILDSLSTTDIKVMGVFIRKDNSNNPKWWSKGDNKEIIQKNMIAELTDDLIKSGELENSYVVIDKNPHIKHNEGKEIMELVSKNRSKAKEITEDDSEWGKNRDVMQAADFPIGDMGIQSAGKEYRFKPATLRKLRNDNSNALHDAKKRDKESDNRSIIRGTKK
jgi:hypothetical protein